MFVFSLIELLYLNSAILSRQQVKLIKKRLTFMQNVHNSKLMSVISGFIPADIICILCCGGQVLPSAVSVPIQQLYGVSAPAVHVLAVRSCIRPL